MARLSLPPRLDYSNYTWRRVKISKLLIMQFAPFSCHFILFGPNILLSTLFSNTLSLCSSLNVRDQVSHPYRTIQQYAKIKLRGCDCIHIFVKIIIVFAKQNYARCTKNLMFLSLQEMFGKDTFEINDYVSYVIAIIPDTF
jgi:hypothetical protein